MGQKERVPATSFLKFDLDSSQVLDRAVHVALGARGSVLTAGRKDLLSYLGWLVGTLAFHRPSEKG